MVIDASAAIEVVTGTRAGHEVLDAIDGQQLDAPEMVYLETLRMTHPTWRLQST